MTEDLQILLRLLVALVLGGVVGWERQAAGKSAGLRTHILVAMGAALFVGLGELFIQRFSHAGDTLRFDPIRIVEAVVTGVSFLGAGTIFVARGSARVRGLTTAASIWLTAAIGLAVGLERYVLAAGSTVLAWFVLRVLQRLDDAAGDTGRPS
jgi:putative Mg2+ transporter-C (MgtC) family protein